MRSRWLSPGAIKLHVAAFLVLAGCMAAFWWQLGRALGGHSQSWAYAVEWPVFAAYALWMWWKLLREEFAGPGAEEGEKLDPLSEIVDDEDEAEHRAWVAYNEYLAQLSAANRQRRR